MPEEAGNFEILFFISFSGASVLFLVQVRQFGQFLASSAENQDQNKAILKVPTGHLDFKGQKI